MLFDPPVYPVTCEELRNPHWFEYQVQWCERCYPAPFLQLDKMRMLFDFSSVLNTIQPFLLEKLQDDACWGFRSYLDHYSDRMNLHDNMEQGFSWVHKYFTKMT